MISSFSLKTPQQIIFGQSKFAELQNLIPKYGTTLLIVTGNSSYKETSHYLQLRNILKKLQMQAPVVQIDQEPSPQMIDTAVDNYREKQIDLLIGIGGGSVLDGAKAISAMLAEEHKIVDFLEGVGTRTPTGKKIPLIAIPTTSGTGSEATSNAVISQIGHRGHGGFKKSLRHDNYIPDIALVDPELTLSCPDGLTVACGMDCFTQLVEGYLSPKGSPIADLLAIDGIKAISRSLLAVSRDGTNISARTDLSYGALLSGIVLTNSGLGTVHGFASVIGGHFSIPHGVICGSLMAVTNDLTLKALRKTSSNNLEGLSKYATLGKIFCTDKNKSEAWYQDHFITRLYEYSETLQIPLLSSYGVEKKHIQKIAAQTTNKNNPAALSEADRQEIVLSRIH